MLNASNKSIQLQEKLLALCESGAELLYLAEQTGCTREHVTRVMRRLADFGYVKKKQKGNKFIYTSVKQKIEPFDVEPTEYSSRHDGKVIRVDEHTTIYKMRMSPHHSARCNTELAQYRLR